MTVTTFKAADFADRFHNQIGRFESIAKASEHEQLDELNRRLEGELRRHQEDGVLSVAFIGQYSAGKSTIISALTGRRDIEIDTDIATDETTAYDWNGIRIIDTPGLFTERQEHDAITYDAIRKADLLVFTLTYMLFDSVTVENFKRLAYEEGFRDKMMIVVNKMADEAGDPEERIPNYRRSLQDAIKPHDLDEFDVRFVDALDYIDGQELEDEFLVSESRFGTFVNALNDFVDDRGQLGRLDTPVRMLIGAVDDATDVIAQDETGDDAYLELLGRLSRVARNERQRFRRKVNGTVFELQSSIHDLSSDLAANLGALDEDELEGELSKAENKVEKSAECATEDFQEHVETAAERLTDKVADVLTSDLASSFVASVEQTAGVNAAAPNTDNPWSERKQQWEKLEKVGKSAGVSITKAAGGSASGVGGGLLKAADVSGSALHKTVYNVGKFLGVKFKPYGAVNVAKFLGNAAKVVGPLLSFVGLAMDTAETVQDEKNSEKLQEARGELVSEFGGLARELEQKFDEQRREAEEEIFDQVEAEIEQQRKDAQEKIAAENETVEQLCEIRRGAEGLLREIHTG